jgi:4a-hydroxytetrahydrobiopterin dehydratase
VPPRSPARSNVGTRWRGSSTRPLASPRQQEAPHAPSSLSDEWIDNVSRGSRLDSAEVAERLQALDGWNEAAGALHRQFDFASFADAFAFMTRVAFAAEAMDHHPDWSNSYRTVVVDISSHDVGGISDRDFRLAAAIDAVWTRHSVTGES